MFIVGHHIHTLDDNELTSHLPMNIVPQQLGLVPYIVTKETKAMIEKHIANFENRIYSIENNTDEVENDTIN